MVEIRQSCIKENVDKIFSIQHINEVGDTNEFKEIKCNDYFTLLKFLIRSGFIDETFNLNEIKMFNLFGKMKSNFNVIANKWSEEYMKKRNASTMKVL